MEIFKNPVFTASYALKNNFDDFKIKVEGESGRSELTTENDPYAPLTTDFFHYSIKGKTSNRQKIDFYSLRCLLLYYSIIFVINALSG